jgi:hypothetical protein
MAKITFQRLNLSKQNTGDSFEVQFNPPDYTLVKGAKYAEVVVPGLDSPIIQFVNGESEKLNLELFFDTSDEKGTGADAVSVTTKVDPFYRLVKVDGNLHAPPIVRVTWGDKFPGVTTDGNKQPMAAFDAVVESVNRKYTFFSADGVPLRATVSLVLREYKTPAEQLVEMNLRSSDHTRVHVVQEGETLPQIAYQTYQDPARWRIIANHNRLLNPRELAPGTLLHLPPAS